MASRILRHLYEFNSSFDERLLGWCDFAASTGDGQSGTDVDCEVSTYFFAGSGASTGNLLHELISGTAWSMQPSTFPPILGLPADDFFITDGTMSVTGPFVVKFISQLPGPIPLGCSLVGQTATCPLSFWEVVHLYSPHTGVPAAPGHYSLANLGSSRRRTSLGHEHHYTSEPDTIDSAGKSTISSRPIFLNVCKKIHGFQPVMRGLFSFGLTLRRNRDPAGLENKNA